MMNAHEAEQILAGAELIHTESTIMQTVKRLAADITKELSQQRPLIICVMRGAVVFAGQLLPQLRFPLDFDYVHVTRYHNRMQGGEIQWLVAPPAVLNDQTVLVVDDILDEGITLAAIREQILKNGAKAFYSAVLVEKETAEPKPFQADFVGLRVPDRYVFGCGMDIRGAWRNLPAIYAVKD
ncbi:hypoxanthine-guanine phosphoribosyltransferase [Nitrosomonas sp. JL21]|uniref:hypoxanthine-guanine phosphoribosyltransferase n=1 Tax=Nitrosomonas sp. JL21 TaxID=153949 RepID=UPI0013690BFB|nr:hypoxanthine-guanine phosphoribosyltransferase [Nitrosomonas sp. JL21]MBL8497899.1 hypoxanthine-guanine phosphoribosyltransferase [Nitrosomonas sp.]MCC7090772.1 hypoxanthine-guanine phosphoribosyltransferase [Nitrosomonas sp.]MXS78242.1 hypoxanthine-guanine phosphoribosyltransferase [Nitrosomonas sp. JL21]